MSTLPSSNDSYIEVDARGRTSLARFVTERPRLFAVEELDGGTLVLRPARLVTEDDLLLASQANIVEESRRAAEATEDELTEVDLDAL